MWRGSGVSGPGRRSRSSRTALRASSRGSRAWPTPGTTSTACSASLRRRHASSSRRRCGGCSPTASTFWGSAPRIGCDVSLLVVGSIALDSVYTPFGETADAPGGSAVFFSAAGAILHPVPIVGGVGAGYPLRALKTLEARGVDLAGVEQAPGESFRWKAKYSYDLASRETLETRLGVFADFRPKLPPKFRDARYVFLGNIDPELQLGVLDQVKQPALVACDTMNYWIHSKRDLLLELLRHIDILMVNDSEARELSGDWNIYRAARWVLERGPKMTVIKQGEHGALHVNHDAVFKVPAYPLQEVFDRSEEHTSELQSLAYLVCRL